MVEMTETSNEKLFTKIAVSLLALFLLVSWLPAFGLPLGNSHEGRVLGQFALHMKNFWNLGIIDSSFGASWEPFSDIPYTHHPPLLTFLHIIVSTIFGEGLKQVKLISYSAGILTIPALFLMGKILGMNTKAVLVAILLLIATPWWWVYGRLGLGLLPNVLMIGSVWAATINPTKQKVVLASLSTFFAVMASWHGVFLMPFLLFRTWRRRKFDRLTFSLLGVSAIGGLLILFWVSQGGGLSELGGHIEQRVQRDWTWGQFAQRQWSFLKNLLPVWYLILALPAFIAGIIDSRTRFLTTSLTLMVCVFALVPSNGAWIHDYWNFPILLVLFPGFVVLGEWVIGFVQETIKFNNQKIKFQFTVTVFLFLTIILTLGLKPQKLHDNYFDATSNAGELIAKIELSNDQITAWHMPEIPWPTWVSNNWNLPTESIANAEDLEAVPSGDIVLLRIDMIPDWLDKEIQFALQEREGNYGAVKAEVMKKYA